MKIDCINSMFTSNCYLVHYKNNVYIIDPSVNINVISKYIKEEEIVKGILITHGHIDHIYYLQEVQNYFDCVIYASSYAKEIIIDNDKNFGYGMGINKQISFNPNAFIEVKDNDVILDNVEIISTPGHSLDSICIKIENVLFTGDTLFDSSIGRWDLYGGDFDILEESLRKLLKYKDLDFYPGHGDKSTISLQLLTNPYFRSAVLKNKKSF